MANINIVLVEPEIPQNTGNVARTCACTGATLHLVKPMMFKIDDAHLKRAGLDYWSKLDVKVHESLADFLEYAKGSPMVFATSKGARCYTDIEYPDGCYILFGKETKGLPEDLLLEHYDDCIRIPMRDTLRCLNLSNSVAVVIYEALRQSGFAGLREDGKLSDMPKE
jgi:tRNA (cytidine/uridine-2'-O-)-methyltransferase